jgi:branched-chain amino acid transport system substrate-binding protein
MQRFLMVIAAVIAAVAASASSAQTLKLGFMAPMSGPSATAGQEMKRGLDAALEKFNNRIGGLETHVVIADDKGLPDTASQEVVRLIEREKIDVLSGLGLTNVMLAVTEPAVKANVIVLASHAGTGNYAGKGCNPNIFLTGFLNDIFGITMGPWLTKRGVKRLYIMGLDFQAGWDIYDALQRTYNGQVVGKALTPFTQVDFAPELAQIRAAKPDGVFAFYFGASGVAFPKQYAQSGLKDQIPLYSVMAMSNSMLIAGQGDAGLGVISNSVWNAQIDNASNKEFVARFRAKYGREPASYSSMMYDSMLLLDAALRTGVDPANRAALRNALRTVKFPSIRGDVHFGPNQAIQQSMVFQQAMNDSKGQFMLKPLDTAAAPVDEYAKYCKMN